MTKIYLQTYIDAPVDECFNASRNIDLHASSMSRYKEKAIAGRTSGLIELGESVTWEARHFGIRMHLTSIITQMDVPYSFTDEMKKGPFRFLHHVHQFQKQSSGTLMTDIFRFESPYGILGKLADAIVLKRYMERLLSTRNRDIKSAAEQIRKDKQPAKAG